MFSFCIYAEKFVNNYFKLFIASRDTEKYIADHVPKLPSRFFIKTYLSTYQHGSALDQVDLESSSAMELLKYEIQDYFLASNPNKS